MTRLTFASLFAFAAVSMAHAEDAKILKIDPQSHADHMQVVETAEQLCRQARLHDLFDEYGTQEECVQNTLQDVHPWHGDDAASNTRLISAR